MTPDELGDTCVGEPLRFVVPERSRRHRGSIDDADLQPRCLKRTDRENEGDNNGRERCGKFGRHGAPFVSQSRGTQ